MLQREGVPFSLGASSLRTRLVGVAFGLVTSLLRFLLLLRLQGVLTVLPGDEDDIVQNYFLKKKKETINELKASILSLNCKKARVSISWDQTF